MVFETLHELYIFSCEKIVVDNYWKTNPQLRFQIHNPVVSPPPPHRLIKTMYTVVTLHRFVALSKSMMPLAHFPTVRLRTGAVIPKKLWMAERTVSCLITLKTWQNLAWIRIRNREFLPTGFVCEVLTDTVLNVTPTKRPVSKRQVYKTSGLQNTTTQPSLCLQTWLQQNLRIFKNQKYWIYMDVILQP